MDSLEKQVRPWGYYIVLASAASYQIKELVVNPNSKLSYQTHKFREEHWLVIEGKGEALIDGRVQKLQPGSSLTIGIGTPHRLINNTANILKLIEVQTGSYFGEDDILRLADDYNR